MSEIYRLGDVLAPDEHEVGNPECPACYEEGYPRPCRCGGLVHSSFGDESVTEEGEENIWCYHGCDRCGDNYEEVERG